MKKLSRAQANAEIPTASMADIAFLLIIFFMVTAVFAVTRGLDFELPEKKDVPQDIEREEAVHIKVLADNSYVVDGRPMPLDDLLGYLAPKLINWPDKPVMIQTDPNADYQAMLAAYDVLRTAQPDTHGFFVKVISIPTLAEIDELERALGMTF
jgi:biopolymer transport protein ExbD